MAKVYKHRDVNGVLRGTYTQKALGALITTANGKWRSYGGSKSGSTRCYEVQGDYTIDFLDTFGFAINVWNTEIFIEVDQ